MRKTFLYTGIFECLLKIKDKGRDVEFIPSPFEFVSNRDKTNVSNAILLIS